MDSSNKKLGALTVGAIGVVFGDIGTSPLYALKESFSPAHGIPLNQTTVFGILSVMFWAMTALVTVKYLLFMMRADNKGEGGILALTALAQRCFRKGTRRHWWVVALGMAGAAMFYGDAIITPAMSVLSAVEGLALVTPAFNTFVVPIAVGILIALFAIQRHGTAAVARFFGPIMVLWFSVLAILGISQIIEHPGILAALNPWYSWQFFIEHKIAAWITLGAVVLCVTGGEALYADMGHFGRQPIRVGWFTLVWPALLLNYFGQGALLLAQPETVKKPVLSHDARVGLTTNGGARHLRNHHRFASCDFRRIQLNEASDSAWLFATLPDSVHQRKRSGSNLYSLYQLGLTYRHHGTRDDFPYVKQFSRRLRHRRDAHHDNRHIIVVGRDALHLEMESSLFDHPYRRHISQ